MPYPVVCTFFFSISWNIFLRLPAAIRDLAAADDSDENLHEQERVTTEIRKKDNPVYTQQMQFPHDDQQMQHRQKVTLMDQQLQYPKEIPQQLHPHGL